MSIGSLSRAVGIPANTLRTWERRYDFPVPERTVSGHRVYPATVVPHLALVGRAVERGHRPSHVMRLNVAELRGLLQEAVPSPPAVPGSVPDSWRAAVDTLDGHALASLLRREALRHDLLSFLEQHVVPLLVWIGDAWASGDIGVHNEHVASAAIRAFLSEQVRTLSPPGVISTVCAALPGERHDMGVHLCAATAAFAGRRPMTLEGATPVEAIARAAQESNAHFAAISVSAQMSQGQSGSALAELARLVGPGVPVLVGGAGAPEIAIDGVERLPSLRGLQHRLATS